MARSTRRLCVLLLLLLAVAATFSCGHGGVLGFNHEPTATFPGRPCGGPGVSCGGGAYHGSGFSHVPRSYQTSVGVGDYSAGDRGRVWNVGALVVAPVLAAAWFA
jgi:hypothetical protein